MKKETTSRSADKLAEAIGLIKEEYIEEAHNGTLMEDRETQLKLAEDTANKQPESGKAQDKQALKWKKISRRAGIVIAAAVVVLIVAAVILLPGRQGGYAGKTEMAAATAAAEAAPAEENGVDMAYEAAEPEMMEEAAAEAEEGYAMAVSDSQAAGGAAQMENDNKGCAVKYDHALLLPEDGAEESAYEYPEGYEPAGGIIIQSADQLKDYLKQASFEPSGTVEYAGKTGSSLQEVFDDSFFKEHNLALSFVEVSSGSYQVNYLSTEEKDGTAEVHYNVYRPDWDPEKGAVVTMDMADWMLVSAVSKDVTDTVTTEEEYPY